MCHLLLLLPILALPVFWILPLSVAAPVYALVAVVSVAVYVGVVKATRSPVLTGKEHMLGATGEVVASTGSRLTVQIHGELWAGEAVRESLKVGDTARVVAVDGLHLSLSPTSTSNGAVSH